jgi:hypothetical protein
LQSKKNEFAKEAIRFYGNVSAFSNPDHPVSQVRKLYEDADFALEKDLELLKPENVFVQDYEKLNSQYQTVIKCLKDLRDKKIPDQENQIRQAKDTLRELIDTRKTMAKQLKKQRQKRQKGISDDGDRREASSSREKTSGGRRDFALPPEAQQRMQKVTSQEPLGQTDYALSPEAQRRMRQATSQTPSEQRALAQPPVSDASTLPSQATQRSYRRDKTQETVNTPEGDRKLVQFLYDNKTPEPVLRFLSSAFTNAGIIDQRPIGHERILISILSKKAPEDLKRLSEELKKLKAVRKELHNWNKPEASSENKSFIDKWKRALDYTIYSEMINLDYKEFEQSKGPEKQSRIYTKAVIDLGPGIEPIETIKRKPGDIQEAFTPYPPDKSRELRVTHADAEVATLKDIRNELEARKTNGEHYETINITILGLHGPCNGCDYRIQQFAEEWENSGLCKTLNMNACYDQCPSIVLKPESEYETQFGRVERAMRIKTFKGRTVYMENYVPSTNKVADEFLEHDGVLPQQIKDTVGQHGLSPEKAANLATLIAEKVQQLPENKRIQIEKTIRSNTGKEPGAHVRDYFRELTRIGNMGLLYGKVADDFLEHKGELSQPIKDTVGQHGLSPEEANNLVQLIFAKVKLLPENKRSQIKETISSSTGKNPGDYVRDYFRGLTSSSS